MDAMHGRRAINQGLADVWRLLLAVSEAGDGSNPAAAADPLRRAGRRLLEAADQLERTEGGTP